VARKFQQGCHQTVIGNCHVLTSGRQVRYGVKARPLSSTASTSGAELQEYSRWHPVPDEGASLAPVHSDVDSLQPRTPLTFASAQRHAPSG